LTERLRSFSGGDRESADAVLREILPKLHQIAARALNRRNGLVSLSPTELINEVWLTSLHRGHWEINDREHFYAIVSNAMRYAIINFARSQLAQRRGGGMIPIHLEADSCSGDAALSCKLETVVQVGILMERLHVKRPETARIVDLHYFVGLTFEETAKIMALSVHQVRDRWEEGCDWLKDQL
jgi:RNA polymerase sigma factor (TIGR02999 family)